jgi:acetyl esterase/lipase
MRKRKRQTIPRRAVLIVTVLLASAVPAAAQDWMQPVSNPTTTLLWPGGAPGALGTSDEDKPTLTIYQPAGPQNTGTAIVICPGGGYTHLAMDHEGHQVARLLTTRGITGVILKYRLGPRYHHPAMQQDVLQAIRWVRFHAADLHVRPDRVGVMGFSAGGHLASTAATLFDAGHASAPQAIDRTSSRPDFAILAYPVIVMGDDVTHRGSQTNLLGPSPSPELVKQLSTDKQVTTSTPPTFLFHTNADTGVPAENSVRFYLALRKAGVPAELHIYEQGAHGVGLAPADPALRTWTDRMFDWLQGRGLLTPPKS